jgi:hypothetical protein
VYSGPNKRCISTSVDKGTFGVGEQRAENAT